MRQPISQRGLKRVNKDYNAYFKANNPDLFSHQNAYDTIIEQWKVYELDGNLYRCAEIVTDESGEILLGKFHRMHDENTMAYSIGMMGINCDLAIISGRLHEMKLI